MFVVDRAVIQAAMRAAFPQAEERVARFYAMQEYHLGWRDPGLAPAAEDPGKLIRPQLALLACRAVGGDPLAALPLAAGIQLIHDFSLIHDDIEDHSDTRRGRPTVWNLWGLAQGINAGDGMFILAHLAVHQLADQGHPPALVLEVLRRFDRAILRICEGQFLDLSFEGNLAISADDYLAMIERKTAVLVSAAAELGALAGGADEAVAAACAAFGLRLGLSFQIQDDVLGIWGDPAVTGKPAAADLYRRKVSLPIVYTLQQPGGDALAAIYRAGDPDAAAVQQALVLLDQAGARQYAEHESARLHAEALQALDQVRGDAATIEHLRMLANSLLGRQK